MDKTMFDAVKKMIGGKGQDPRGFATLTRDGDAVVADLTSVYPQARKVFLH